MGHLNLTFRIIIEGDRKDSPDLFDTEYVFDEGGGLQEGLLVCHQSEQKKNKVVPGCQALCHSLRLHLEIKIEKYIYIFKKAIVLM